MSQPTPPTRHVEAAAEFNQHEGRADGERIAASLMAGLNTLCEVMLSRISIDVERAYGADSMLMPVSAVKGQIEGRKEIETYLAIESAEAARTGGYLASDDDWYAQWLIHLRLGDWYDPPRVGDRLAAARGESSSQRRRTFERSLVSALPEAGRAPLIIYRMLPLAAWLATAAAFGDAPGAVARRRQQLQLLPNLADCPRCRGALLENGEQCRQCGNPLWKFDWLTAE